MTAYIVVPGDIVDFTDTTTGKKHRGYVDVYKSGRDMWNIASPPSMKRSFSELRDYLVVFDEEPFPGVVQAWCAPQDLTIVRKANNMNSNVKIVDVKDATTNNVYYSSNSLYYSDNSISDDYKDNRNKWTETWNDLKNVSEEGVRKAEEKDRFRPYYLTSRQFFDVLETAFNDTYGSDHEWHPEDLYANVEAVLEVATNTLTNSMRVKNGQSARGIKEINNETK